MSGRASSSRTRRDDGSSGSQPHRDSDDDRDVSPPRTGRREGDDRLYLSSAPGTTGIWWDDKRIKKLLGDSYQLTYPPSHEDTKPVCNWKTTTPAYRETMWNYFQSRVCCDADYNMRAEYERTVARRLSRDISYAYKHAHCFNWIDQDSFRKIMGRSDDPEFVELSTKNQKNRMTGSVGGKARETSLLGQHSSATAFKSLGPDANPHALMKKSKQRKDGSWIHPRAAIVDENYRRLEAQQSESEDSTADFFALYQAASGGYDAKHRVFGLGNAARELLTPPTVTRGSQSTAGSSYTPTVVSQFAHRNAQLEQQIEGMRREQDEMRRRQEMLEKFMAEQFSTFTPGCRPPGGPGGPDDLGGGGGGFCGQSITPLD